MPFDAVVGGEGDSGLSSESFATHDRQQKIRRSYAALDLGTNNCRLLIARPTRSGFYVVDAFSRIVRLGEGLMQTGALSTAAQDRAVAALRICADKLNRRGVWMARNVATEACRQATNGDAFVARVYAETGLALDVITPKEEARLAVLGCQALIAPGHDRALVFDIGGGSTELILVDLKRSTPDIIAWTSVPWGVVSLAETEDADLPTFEARMAAFARMKQRVQDHLTEFAGRTMPLIGTGRVQMLGTSGTVTTLASLYLDLPSYDRRLIDGCWVPSAAMREISTRLAGMSAAERIALPCIGSERSDLVVAGCAILDALLDNWSFETLRVADRGIREGILRTLIARDGGR